MEKDKSKTRLFRFIKENKIELTPVDLTESNRSKSEVWEKFGDLILKCEIEELQTPGFVFPTVLRLVNGIEETKIDNYVGYFLCQTVYHYKSKNGTSTLKNHLEKCLASSQNQNMLITDAFNSSKSGGHSRKLPDFLKKQYLNAETKFIVHGYHAFRTVEDHAYIDLLQIVSKLSARFGELDMQSLTHSTKSLTKQIETDSSNVINMCKQKATQLFGTYKLKV